MSKIRLEQLKIDVKWIVNAMDNMFESDRKKKQGENLRILGNKLNN